MGEILSKDNQLELLRDVVQEIGEHSNVERLAVIAAFAAIVGQIQERNLINLLNYAKIWDAKTRPMVYPILKYYIYSNIIDIKDNNKGLLKELNKTTLKVRASDREVALLVKENIKRIRKRYLPNGV